MKNLLGDTKSVDDMMFNEVIRVGSFDFNKWYSFCPL